MIFPEHGADLNTKARQKRRFDLRRLYYHPTEIKATLKGAREFFGNKKIWCIFQPHLYSRTKLLLYDFGKSFGGADEIVLVDIYAAREPKDESINSKMLAEEITKNGGKAVYMKSFDKIANFLAENTKKAML